MDVKRPRFNAAISSKGVVRLATGGMHVLALCADGKIYSWGVNDQGALGRDTRWEGVLKDMDADSEDSDDEDSDSGMNPHEANPAAIDSKFFHPESVIVDVVAGDSCSFALTAEGRVYGWGTFRVCSFTLHSHF
jgi:regulator of chromosome condensation